MRAIPIKQSDFHTATLKEIEMQATLIYAAANVVLYVVVGILATRKAGK